MAAFLLLLDHAEDLVLADDDQLDPIDLDLVAAVLAEQDAVTLLHIQRANDAFVVGLSAADRHHLALGGLLLGGVGDDDPALGLLFTLNPLHENAILKWPNFHGFFLLKCRSLALRHADCWRGTLSTSVALSMGSARLSAAKTPECQYEIAYLIEIIAKSSYNGRGHS